MRVLKIVLLVFRRNLQKIIILIISGNTTQVWMIKNFRFNNSRYCKPRKHRARQFFRKWLSEQMRRHQTSIWWFFAHLSVLYFSLLFVFQALRIFSCAAWASIEYFPSDSIRIRLPNYIYVQVALSSFPSSIKGERESSITTTRYSKNPPPLSSLENPLLHVAT